MLKKTFFSVFVAVVAMASFTFAADEDPCAKPDALTEIDGYYQIGTCGELLKFAEMANANCSINGKLTADIVVNTNVLADADGVSKVDADGNYTGNAPANVWTPIGTSSDKYNGTFDGNGYTIRGLYFNDENTDYVGLFGYIGGYGSNAKVQNVGVVDSYFKGYRYVGGVVGKNDNGIVSNVYNTGSVSGNSEVGGVVGGNYGGTVSNVYNTGIVSGLFYVGGVVGFSGPFTTVSNVYNTGAVSGTNEVGGVVGFSGLFTTVSNVYNTGSVSGASCVGGVVGKNDNGVVSNVYNTGVVSGDSEVGGVVGGMDGGDIGGMDGGDINNAYYDNQTCNDCNSYGTGKPLSELANLTIGSKADDGADFPLLKGETESPWAKGIYYDKATEKLAIIKLPYLKSLKILPKPQDVEMEFNVKDNVIQISSAEDLKNFAKLVNEYDIRDVDAELTTSITLNSNLLGENNANVNAETGEYTGNAPANVWTPIGTYDNQYTGKFDGKGNTVSGLYFNDGEANDVGLFGFTGTGATVQNVGVIDSYLRGRDYVGGVVGNNWGRISNVYNTGSVSGNGSVGGVVGENNNGTVSNVYNTGSVSGDNYVSGVVGYNSGSTISNAYNAGSVSGSGDVGGVVGYNLGSTISNVYNTGSVSGNGSVGGVVGTNNGTIGNVYNTGSVNGTGDYVGGVVGNNWGRISNVYNTGSVNGTGDYVGGVVGYNDGTIGNVYNTGSVNGTGDYVGGVVGKKRNDDITNAYYNTDVACEKCNSTVGVGKTTFELASAKLTDLGFDDQVWEKGGVSYEKSTGKLTLCYPYLKKFSDAQHKETIQFFTLKNNVIQIKDSTDLKNFAKLVNEYGVTRADAELTGNICLNACEEGEKSLLEQIAGLGENVDISTLGFKQWTPIGTNDNRYTGTFDGKGYTVSGLYFNDDSKNEVGLFGITTRATVQNVGVIDSYIRGNNSVGGVVGGMFDGTISNVNNTGSVSGDNYVGGVVGGMFDGTISNVYNTGSVSGTGDGVGGVVGFNGGTIGNVYNTGSVSGTGDYVGGVVGENNNGTVSNGFFNTEVYNTEVTCKNCSVVEGTTGMSSEEFADGTVALLLHDWCEMDGGVCKEGGLDGTVWGQNVGQATGNDAAPTLSGVLKLGPLTVAKTAAGKDSAAIDGASELEMKIPAVFNVPSVTFKRNFSSSGYSTIMLPFKPECAADDCVEGVKFYEFASYTDGEVQATEVSQKDLKANTPYLVQVTGASEIVFKNGGTFNTTTGDAYDSENGEYKVELGGDGAGWTIYGTYEYKSWEKGDAGLGKTYGFAANDGVNDPSIVGQFAKIGVGAYIYPMRAYLEYVAPAKQSRPAANGAVRAFAANTVASLPETINVVIVEKGETGTEVAGSEDGAGTMKVIGTVNTRTGEFKFVNDRWFDLQGRYLGNKKPTQKGAYYNNGKKVIVK